MKNQDRFKTQFYELMVELASDEEGLVRIEGIELMTEYLSLIKKNKVEEDYIPNVEKMFHVVMDPICDDETRIRMAKLSGKILDKLAVFFLDTKYSNMFIDFCKTAINDKLMEVRLGLIYNLPCYYFTFKNDEESREYLDSVYFEQSQEMCDDLLKQLVLGVHEPLSLISQQSSLGIFKETLRNLMLKGEIRQVRDGFASNIDRVIEHYAKDQDVRSMIE